MQTIISGVEFLSILARFKKRMENSSLYVHVLQEALHLEVSSRSRAVDVNECTKKRDALAELLFC